MQIFALAKIIVVLASANLLINCANQRAPSGGPPDETPPRILEITPAKNSTLVPLDQKVEFVFSEGMDRKSLDRAIFITPDPVDRVKYNWKGKKLQVEFSDSLKSNRTYVITLGTDLKDAHGNALTGSYTLAFSTGAQVSNGKIGGTVYSESPQGALIWAYILEDGRDPQPAEKSGDYVTQADTKGQYELSNLSEGRYRLFAIKDKDNNRFFETGVDALGVPFRDVELTKDELAAADLNFRMTTRDTLGPALISVSAPSRTQLRLRFDEMLAEAAANVPQNYSIKASEPAVETLAVRFAYVNSHDPLEVVLITGAQRPRVDYEVLVGNVTDVPGNPIDPNFATGQFTGSALSDSLGPRLLAMVPNDSARVVPLDSKVSFQFSEPIDPSPFVRNFKLLDSLGQSVGGSFAWKTPAHVEFSPEKALMSMSSYLATALPDSTLDLLGNALVDSLAAVTFRTLNIDTLSSISGTLSDQDSLASGKIYLKITAKEGSQQTYEIQLDAPGPYKFEKILPGNYSIEGFRDRDNNGEYSFGATLPFSPAERFFVYPDQIQVRARWPNEGNDLRLKK